MTQYFKTQRTHTSATLGRNLMLAFLMALGVAVVCHVFFHAQHAVFKALLYGFDWGGTVFVRLIQMVVLPVVMLSIICGLSQLQNVRHLGSMGWRTFFMYLATTCVALGLAILFATLFKVGGHGVALQAPPPDIPSPPDAWHTILQMIPHRPFAAMASANML